MHAEIYTRNPCPHCDRAKQMMKQNGVAYTEITVDETTKPQLVERVLTATITDADPQGQPPKSVPQIFLDGQYIGGADQLALYFKTSGKAQSGAASE